MGKSVVFLHFSIVNYVKFSPLGIIYYFQTTRQFS